MALPTTQPVILYIPNGAGGNDTIPIDACLTENHTLANTLTDHPVEQGANITDHSRPEPRRVSLDCVQTNTPIDVPPDGTDYAAGLWQRFVDLHNNPKLIEVQTARDYYRNMGVESITSTVDSKTAQALKFTVGLKEVRVVQNKFTRVVKATDPRAHPNKKQGITTTSDGTPADNRTAAAKLLDAITGAHP